MNYVNGGVQAAATVYEGYQRAANYETAAKQDQVNADTARVQGSADEDRLRWGNEEKLGMQRAAIAESGFSGSSASMDTLQGQSAGQLELNALTLRYKAQMTALDFENQRDANNQAARTTRHNANIAKIAAFIGGTSGGGSSVSSDAPTSPYARAKTSDEVSALYSDQGYGTAYNGYGT